MNRLLLFLLCFSAARLAAQSCVSVSCPPAPVDLCDFSNNRAELWNEPYWLDTLHQSHDLPESPTEFQTKFYQDCGGTLSVYYLLFLDLNSDGIRETVVDSRTPPAAGTVLYGNGPTAPYNDGTARSFDERSVPQGQKFRFAIEVVYGGSYTLGRVRWNTDDAPGTFVNAELPYGNHMIRWVSQESGGERDSCEYAFSIRDCKPPTIVCYNGLNVDILPTTFVTIWTADLVQYTDDNLTPSPELAIALRRSGTGTGFPEDSSQSITFNCFDLGIQPVEVWARDKSGNEEYCETYVTVNDAAGNCAGVIGTDEPGASFQVAVPNPFADRLNVALHADRAATLFIRLHDLTGREMFLHRQPVEAGDQRIELPTAALPDGVYFMSITDETGAYRVRSLIKRSF